MENASLLFPTGTFGEHIVPRSYLCVLKPGPETKRSFPFELFGADLRFEYGAPKATGTGADLGPDGPAPLRPRPGFPAGA